MSLALPIVTSLALSVPLSPPRTAIGDEAKAATAAPVPVEQQVDAVAAEHLKRRGAVGLSIAVGRGGAVTLAKGYGLADAELDVPANAETAFRIGSVTKQFTAAAVLRLVERGQLALDDPLEKHVQALPLQGRHVTIRHLLNHTSGIPSYTDIGLEWREKWPLELEHEELLALVKDKPFDFEPGARWAYNNTGYYLLGMVVEAVTGTSYAQHVQRDLFEPLGLARTRCDSNVDLIKNRAQGYTLRRGELVNDQVFGLSQPGAAGALISTAGDLVRWQIALTTGKVVTPAGFAAMTQPTELPDGKREDYGFGLSLNKYMDRRAVHHGGGIFGFNSILVWLPDDDLHVAVISNGEPLRSEKVAADVVRAVLGIPREVVKDEPIPADLRRKLVGEYGFPDGKLDTTVYEDGDALQAQAAGQSAFRLQWQGGHEFRAAFDTEVRLVFTEDGRGFTLHQNGRELSARRKD